MKLPIAGATLAVLLVGAVGAVGAEPLPPDVLVSDTAKNRTVWPYPQQDSGKLVYKDHRRDLSKWPTLSYDDKRATPKPERKHLNGPLNGDPARGKQVAMNKERGNCWACHALPGDSQPGSAGPSLLGFKARGYSDDHVYMQVWDARTINAYTAMPPFGTFGTLTDQEIRDVVAFLQSID